LRRYVQARHSSSSSAIVVGKLFLDRRFCIACKQKQKSYNLLCLLLLAVCLLACLLDSFVVCDTSIEIYEIVYIAGDSSELFSALCVSHISCLLVSGN